MSDKAFVHWMTIIIYTTLVLLASTTLAGLVSCCFAPTDPVGGWLAIGVLGGAIGVAVGPGWKLVAVVDQAWAAGAADRLLVARTRAMFEKYDLLVDEHGEIYVTPRTERIDR